MLRVLCLLALGALLTPVLGCATTDAMDTASPVTIGPSLELLNLGDELFKKGKYGEAKDMYARAVNANGPNHAYVEACAQVARMESLTGSLTDGEPWLQLAMRRASRDEPLGWSRLQQVLGIFERESGSRDSAVKRFKALYDYCLKNQLYERAIDAAHHVVLASDDSAEQMVWSQKGIDAAEAGGLQGWLAVLWNNKGSALEDQGRWGDALVAYRTAKTYHYQTGNKQRMLIADWAVARALRMTGARDEAWAMSKDTYGWAARRYKEDPTPNNAEWVGYTTWELAELSALDGDTDKALAGLREARASLIEAGIESWREFGQKELARLDARIAALAGGEG